MEHNQMRYLLYNSQDLDTCPLTLLKWCVLMKCVSEVKNILNTYQDHFSQRKKKRGGGGSLWNAMVCSCVVCLQ